VTEIQVQSTDAIEEPKKESILIEVGELSINIEKFEVKVRGKVIDLTLREFEVLKYLANQPGQVVTRETLLEKVWGYEYYGDIRTVDVTVRRIREKIEKDTSAPKILITKRGVGYYLATN
jgi:two-component system response regulator VicR